MNTKLLIVAAAAGAQSLTIGAGAIGYGLAVLLHAPPPVPYGLMSPQEQAAYRQKEIDDLWKANWKKYWEEHPEEIARCRAMPAGGCRPTELRFPLGGVDWSKPRPFSVTP